MASLTLTMPTQQRLTAKEYRDGAAGDAKKPAKYRNVKTPFESTQGFKLVAASKREARTYADLDVLLATRFINRWVPQVGFLLQGGSRYVCDALVFWSDGHVEIWDAKGTETPAFKIKRGLMKSTYNLEIETV